jgi:hypothetical protein
MHIDFTDLILKYITNNATQKRRVATIIALYHIGNTHQRHYLVSLFTMHQKTISRIPGKAAKSRRFQDVPTGLFTEIPSKRGHGTQDWVKVI